MGLKPRKQNLTLDVSDIGLFSKTEINLKRQRFAKILIVKE
jgi:hypothetical protein